MAVRRPWLWLGAVLVAALGLRLLYVATADVELESGFHYDMSFYHLAGEGLAAGKGYTYFGIPTAAWPPGYPVLIAAAHWLSDTPLLLVQRWQVVLGTVTCLLTFLIGRRLFSPAHGLVAAALLALSPEAISFTPLILSEVLFTTLFAGLVLLFVRWNAGVPAGTARWLGYGMLVGLAALVRGIAVLFPLVLVGVWLVMRLPLGTTVRRSLAVAGGMLVVLAPWTVRNQLVLGAPVLISTEVGEVLFVAHSPFATGGLTLWDQNADWAATRRHADQVQAARVRADHLPPAERAVHENREQTRRAIRYFLTHPARELQLVVPRLLFLYRNGRAAYMWGRRMDETGRWRLPLYDAWWDGVLVRVADAWFYGVLAFGLLGVPWAWSRAAPSRLVLPMTVLWLTALHGIVFFGDPRFHYPLLPVLAVLASSPLLALAARAGGIASGSGDAVRGRRAAA